MRIKKSFNIIFWIFIIFVLIHLVSQVRHYYSKEAKSCGVLGDGVTCTTYRCDTGYARSQPRPGGSVITCSDQSTPRSIKGEMTYN